MVRRKGKSISFDAMIKFFMQNYDIPRKRDIDKIIARIDQLEALIRKTSTPSRVKGGGGKKSAKAKPLRVKSPATASDTVLEVIKRFKNGVGISEIQTRTGFAEKKLRNIIFRLNKMKKIKRKNRGIYVVS